MRLQRGTHDGYRRGSFLIAIGAILAFAVQHDPAGVQLDAVGWILMVVGARVSHGATRPRPAAQFQRFRHRATHARRRSASALDPHHYHHEGVTVARIAFIIDDLFEDVEHSPDKVRSDPKAVEFTQHA